MLQLWHIPISQSLPVFFGYTRNLASVLLISCFMKIRNLSYRFRLMTYPKSKSIHNLFTNCAPFHPFPIHIHFQSISISNPYPFPIHIHFQSISISNPYPFSIHIHFHMDFHSTEGLYIVSRIQDLRSSTVIWSLLSSGPHN